MVSARRLVTFIVQPLVAAGSGNGGSGLSRFRTRRTWCGVGLLAPRWMAGHEDLRTTAQYLHGNIEQARQAMARLAETDRGSIVDPNLVLN